MNADDLEAMTQAVADGIRRAYSVKKGISGDRVARYAAMIPFVGCSLAASETSGTDSICYAIFAWMFFWFAFRARSPKRWD